MGIIELISGADLFGGLVFGSDKNDFKNVRGDRIFLADNASQEELPANIVHFNKTWEFDPTNIIQLDFNNEYRWNKFADNGNDKFHYVEYRGTASGSNRSFQIIKHYFYDQKEVLYLKAGENDFNLNLRRKRVVNSNSTPEIPFYSDSELFPEDIIFTGNIGASMFYSKAGAANVIYPYFDLPAATASPHTHYRSELFNKNIKALLTDGSNITMEVEVAEFILNSGELVHFTNYTDSLFDGSFDVVNVSSDPITETTKLKLRKR
jgi:hypothetical protein